MLRKILGGGDVKIPWSCSHGWCYARSWVWGDVNFLWSCSHGWCYARSWVGGDVKIPWSCSHGWCSARSWVWGDVNFLWSCSHGWCYARSWVGGDVKIPWSCSHGWCYARSWVGGDVNFLWSCSHGWCYARSWVGGDVKIPWSCSHGWCYARSWVGGDVNVLWTKPDTISAEGCIFDGRRSSHHPPLKRIRKLGEWFSLGNFPWLLYHKWIFHLAKHPWLSLGKAPVTSTSDFHSAYLLWHLLWLYPTVSIQVTQVTFTWKSPLTLAWCKFPSVSYPRQASRSGSNSEGVRGLWESSRNQSPTWEDESRRRLDRLEEVLQWQEVWWSSTRSGTIVRIIARQGPWGLRDDLLATAYVASWWP